MNGSIRTSEGAEAARDAILTKLRERPNLGRTGTGAGVGELRPDFVADGNYQAECEVVFFAAIWSLVRDGIIVPGTPGRSHGVAFDSSDALFPMFTLTPFGRAVVDNPATVDPVQSDAYMVEARKRLGVADETIYAYLAEALKTYRHGATLASTVMLGVSAELLMDWLIECLVHRHLPPEAQASAIKKRDGFGFRTGARVEAFIEHILRHLQADDIASDLRTQAESYLGQLSTLIRVNRNDVGHGRPQRADAQLALGMLEVYLPLLSLARELADALSTKCCDVGTL